LRYAVHLQFIVESDKCNNSITEYKAILLGLHKLRAMGVQRCILKTGSKVVASQIERECIARDEMLERYLAAVQKMERFFKGFTVQHIERAKNTEVDELAKVVTRKATLPPDVFFQIIEDPSRKIVEPEPRMINVV
jgi:ribonuclease HI